MIPSLVPFMILSGILIRMNLSEGFASTLHPLLKRLFKCNANISYGIIIGFLCGFPMGAKVTADLLKHNKITYEEARFLLSFNNNIGPVYFCSFVIPLLGLANPFPYILGMYGIPLLYGILLRRTLFKKHMSCKNIDDGNQKGFISKKTSLKGISILTALDDSVQGAVQSILSLCGYMILFNTLNILPYNLIPAFHPYIAPLLEITGGLSILETKLPFYSLCILPFGGLSCIAQTNSMIKGTNLSIKEYVIHKLILTLVTVIFYIIFYFFKVISF